VVLIGTDKVQDVALKFHYQFLDSSHAQQGDSMRRNTSMFILTHTLFCWHVLLQHICIQF